MTEAQLAFITEVEEALQRLVDKYKLNKENMCPFFAGVLARFAWRTDTPLELVEDTLRRAYQWCKSPGAVNA